MQNGHTFDLQYESDFSAGEETRALSAGTELCELCEYRQIKQERRENTSIHLFCNMQAYIAFLLNFKRAWSQHEEYECKKVVWSCAS